MKGNKAPFALACRDENYVFNGYFNGVRSREWSRANGFSHCGGKLSCELLLVKSTDRFLEFCKISLSYV